MLVRPVTCLLAVALLAALALPGRPAARAEQGDRYPYIFIDLGTFGGPNSYISIPSPLVNDRGTAVGFADTTMQDPFPASCFNPDCFTSPAFEWRHGVLTDLGALPGAYNSIPNWISPNGLIAGLYQHGAVDPLTNQPEWRAVLWKDGKIHNLGTFGGNWSYANAVNDRGQVAGVALNTIPDPFGASLGGPNLRGLGATQNRAFLWQAGTMQDLGTLGGTDANAAAVNERGQVAGVSYTNTTPNATTGKPTQDPFLWDDGKMVDLGTLGGTDGFPSGLNILGEVSGQSDLVGDNNLHPFLWDRGRLTDIGTFGGNDGSVNWLTDTGQAVGWAEVPIPCSGCAEPGDQVYHAAAWWHGAKTDFGTLPGYRCSVAYGANMDSDIVGTAGLCHGGRQAVLWAHGLMTDLNSVVRPSAMQLTYAFGINERGEIVGVGVLPNGDQHMALLIPRDEADREEVTSNAPATVSSASPPSTTVAPCAAVPLWRARLTRGSRPACIGG